MSKEETPEQSMGKLSLNDDKLELEWPVDRVRSQFIAYFEKQDHTFWRSSPCVPVDDPTLLFTNAGMNQFKPLFLGTCDPNLKMSSLKRAVNSQKCIRAGGKHNDLDDVGKDVYHHTFFEMLGNWSFGAYFKQEAIAFAWECLVDVFGLDKERLYATYFGGDESTPVDDEARQIWLKYLPEERVLPFDAKDNFWEMGATGPCGPCTEIHYDRIGNRDASKLVNADLPDVIEIWNNVFIQFNREPSGELRLLPQQHVDTGMGLERLTSILQNVDSNYDTDIFKPIFAALHQVIMSTRTKASTAPPLPPYRGKVGKADTDGTDMAYRVIADHIRTLCFSIADGAVPSNDGRGYVLRRILRRAVRYGRSNLHAEIGFFSSLVHVVVAQFGTAYPELQEKQDLLYRIIKEEEESFGKTLDKGLVKFEQMAAKSTNQTIFSGEDAHVLYTSMGFPVDLTELMAEERGLKLDKEAFERKMQEEIALSLQAMADKQLKASGGIDLTLEAEQTNYLIKEVQIATTEDEFKYEEQGEGLEATVLEVYVGRNATDKYGFVDSVQAKQEEEGTMIGLLFDKTSFYAESGGQVADSGVATLLSNPSCSIKIENVQVYAGYIVHTGVLPSGGSIRVGDKVSLKVDYDKRLKITSNHTLTHVLNFALREVLVRRQASGKAGNAGQTVDQKGSLVDDAKLRFDFSWNGPVTEGQLRDIEQICMDTIQSGIPVQTMVAPLKGAQDIKTIRAVFGETYPDPVRVVSIAPVSIEDMIADPTKEDWMGYSVEFCGGTHLKNTKEAEDFVLLNEEGIAKGVRRITAVTMQLARDASAAQEELQREIDEADALVGLELEAKIKQLGVQNNGASISAPAKMANRDKLNAYGKRVVAWKKEESARVTGNVLEAVVSAVAEAGDAPLAVCRYDFGVDGKVAKAVMTSYGKRKDATKPFLMVSADKAADRFMVFAFAPKQCGSVVDCKNWVKAATDGTGAKGGGKKDSAQFTASGVEAHVDGVLQRARGFS